MSCRTISWFAVCCSAVLLLGLLLPLETRGPVWDGSWFQGEYRITFLDRAGRPVEDVQLRVENESGNNFHYFPVTDYLPGHVPASDANGVLVFHHAPTSGVSGQGRWLFGLIPTGETSGPVYICRFLFHGREVHRVRYNDLVHQGERTVKRRWKWLTSVELQEQVFQGVEWDGTKPSRLRIFDLNKNGKLDRDELYAAAAAFAAWERAAEIAGGLKPEWEELEFLLVERTMVLDLP